MTAAGDLRLGALSPRRKQDVAVVVTYRCNARCTMCHTWKYPTSTAEEFAPSLLEKLPDSLGRVNITGGEPMLRRDIEAIVDVLSPKAERLEISTNGYFTDRLVALCTRHPDLTVRISLEGLQETNDRIRGIRHGFERAVESYRRLKSVGVKDLGFAVTVQDENAGGLLDLFALCQREDAEFAQAVPHNGYYFHKHDNEIVHVGAVQDALRELMRAFLRTNRPKLWFRAYLLRGLVDHVGGEPRRLMCTAGSDIVFIDPWGEVYPCNARDLSMGNLHASSWEQIFDGPEAQEVRRRVRECSRDCWMTGTAVPAMRRNLPAVGWWVARKKALVTLGLPARLD